MNHTTYNNDPRNRYVECELEYVVLYYEWNVLRIMIIDKFRLGKTFCKEAFNDILENLDFEQMIINVNVDGYFVDRVYKDPFITPNFAIKVLDKLGMLPE